MPNPIGFFKATPVLFKAVDLPTRDFGVVTHKRDFHTLQGEARRYLEFKKKHLADHAAMRQTFCVLRDRSSDEPYVVPFSPELPEPEYSFNVVTLNMMMRGRFNKQKNRYNTGHRLDESQEGYQARIRRVVEELSKLNASIYLLQEAPILKEDITIMEASVRQLLPHGEDCLITWNQAGLMTLIDRTVFPDDEIARPIISENSDPLKERFIEHRFESLNWDLVNGHFPHDTASATLPFVEQTLLTSLSESLLSDRTTHTCSLSADMNLHPHQVSKVLDQGLDGLFHHDVHMKCHVSTLTSPSGHVKAKRDSETETEEATVDGCISVHTQIEHEDLEKAKRGAREYLAAHPSAPEVVRLRR